MDHPAAKPKFDSQVYEQAAGEQSVDARDLKVIHVTCFSHFLIGRTFGKIRRRVHLFIPQITLEEFSKLKKDMNLN